jgi:hypothetical protein
MTLDSCCNYPKAAWTTFGFTRLHAHYRLEIITLQTRKRGSEGGAVVYPGLPDTPSEIKREIQRERTLEKRNKFDECFKVHTTTV